jgi:hypothetical protein
LFFFFLFFFYCVHFPYPNPRGKEGKLDGIFLVALQVASAMEAAFEGLRLNPVPVNFMPKDQSPAEHQGPAQPKPEMTQEELEKLAKRVAELRPKARTGGKGLRAGKGGGKGNSSAGCFICGAGDHWRRECPAGRRNTRVAPRFSPYERVAPVETCDRPERSENRTININLRF